MTDDRFHFSYPDDRKQPKRPFHGKKETRNAGVSRDNRPSARPFSPARTTSLPPAQSSIHELCQLLTDKAPGDVSRKAAADASPLVRNLYLTVCRQRTAFDWLIQQYSNDKMRSRLVRLLYWALAQHFCLNGLPLPVIVDVSTTYAKKHYSAPEAGFINAVLRKICSSDASLDQLLANAPADVQLRLPQALWKRWRDSIKDETKLKEIATAMLLPPPAVFRLRHYPEGTNEDIPVGLVPVDSSCCYGQQLFTATSPEIESKLLRQLSKSEQPQFYVQDPSTLMAPSLLAVKPGERIADLCAAPGGKSVLIAEALNGQGNLISCDRSPQRLIQLNQNLHAFSNVKILKDDATSSSLEPESFDAILLDVPCSNTGVIRHAPDVRTNFSTEKLRELTELQSKILDGASSLVKKGGRLVYSTCSLEPEENTLQVHAFLERHPDFTLEDEQQLYPCLLHDGAFAAKMIRK